MEARAVPVVQVNSNGRGRPSPSVDETQGRWSVNAPHVRKVLQFIRRRGGVVTAPQLVEWDRMHGQRLFTWHNLSAAEKYRLHEARLFLNMFRLVKNGMRVRAFINLPTNGNGNGAGPRNTAYHNVELIAQDHELRSAVIADIRKRMRSLASELRMWHLSAAEQADLFQELRAAMKATLVEAQ